MVKDSIIRFIKGESIEDAELKKVFFSHILITTIVCDTFSAILAIALQKSLICLAIHLALSINLLILYIVGKKDESLMIQKRIYSAYCILIGCLFLPALYLFGGGISSGVPLLYILQGVTTILLLDRALLAGVLFLNIYSAMIAYYIDYKVIHLAEDFTDLGKWTYLDTGMCAIIVGFGLGFFLRKLTSFFNENQKKEGELLNRIEYAATVDPLSGAYNRRYLMDYLDSCIKKVESGELATFSILMFDIDHFKQINDTYGHLAGDDCLKNLVVILKNSLRKVDVITRYGGEEFICVLPTAEDAPAFRRAEQIRVAVENTQLSADIEKTITVSGGVMMYTPGMTSEELIEAADRNLYIAKEEGRNQIVWHEGGIPPLVYAAYSGDTLKPIHNSGRRFSDATKF